MALLKKVHSDWAPQEKPNLQVGEVFDFPGPFEALVRQGMAVLVDEAGNEMELPGQLFECPVCFEKIGGLKAFNDHVAAHTPSVAPVEAEAPAEAPAAEEKPVEEAPVEAALEVASAEAPAEEPMSEAPKSADESDAEMEAPAKKKGKK